MISFVSLDELIATFTYNNYLPIVSNEFTAYFEPCIKVSAFTPSGTLFDIYYFTESETGELTLITD